MYYECEVCLEVKGVIKLQDGKLENNMLVISLSGSSPNEVPKKLKEIKDTLKAQKVGIRKVFFRNYKVEFPLEKEVIKPFTIPFAEIEFPNKKRPDCFTKN